jgi:hypothetical protein
MYGHQDLPGKSQGVAGARNPAPLSLCPGKVEGPKDARGDARGVRETWLIAKSPYELPARRVLPPAVTGKQDTTWKKYYPDK